MRINKREDLRTNLPYYSNDKFMNIKNINEKRGGLMNSLSMNNLCQIPGAKREFGKEIKNILDLTVNQNNFQSNDNIEEKIKYYKKINDDLTNMLNNYDKTFFAKNRKIKNTIINLNIDGQRNKSNEKYFSTNIINEENKKSKNRKNKNKENIDNNISYFENSIEDRYHNIAKKKGDNYMDKIVKINENNKGNKTNDKKVVNANNNMHENREIIKPLEKGNNEDENKCNNKFNNKDNNIIEISDTKNNSNNNKDLSKREESQKLSNIKSYQNNNNPQEVDEYFKEIFCDMQLKENNLLVDPNYLKNTQKAINQKMRAILIDWIVDVHKKYRLKPETLYLAVNIIDRFLSKQNVTTIKLQLVGVVSFLIASKYEDIHPPLVKELADITDGAYVPSQLISMENQILSCLNFDLFYPTQWQFLECYKKKLNLKGIIFYFAWYLMELGLIDFNLINYKGSVIASTVVMLSMKKFKSYEAKEFEKVTGYREKDLENCIKDIKYMLKNNKNEKNLSAVNRKFSHSKFYEASKIKFE